MLRLNKLEKLKNFQIKHNHNACTWNGMASMQTKPNKNINKIEKQTYFGQFVLVLYNSWTEKVVFGS